MGALAAARVGDMLNDRDERGDAYLDRASDLYELLEEDGPLTTDAGYLAEQAFDDGALDSATPLGWSHALRLHATARLGELNALPTTSPEPRGRASVRRGRPERSTASAPSPTTTRRTPRASGSRSPRAR